VTLGKIEKFRVLRGFSEGEFAWPGVELFNSGLFIARPGGA
jgi:hypothetical protein